MAWFGLGTEEDVDEPFFPSDGFLGFSKLSPSSLFPLKIDRGRA